MQICLFYVYLMKSGLILTFLIEIYANMQFYMVSFRQEQHSIMNFAVAFLNLLTLYMLWRAQFLTEFYAVFCIYQILIFLPLWAKILDQMVSQKVRIFFLLLAIFQAEKKLIF